MDKLIYTAMTGAKHDLLRQDVLAHNLANANTPGFRAQTVAFRSVPLLDASGTRTFAIESTPGADLSPGPIQSTGRPLDIAVNGAGWIAVDTPSGGEAYTRNGSLQIGPDGMLRTHAGRLVLSEGGPIGVPPDHAIAIGRDGTVSAVPETGARAPVALGRIKLVNPPQASLARGDDGLFRLRAGGVAETDERVALAPACIEGSNVNPVAAMVAMIALARQFDMQMKLLQDADANARTAAQLLSVNA
ncbi:MAG: flagellar basal-body rod protein FlgF [Burkholderiales bacterium]|nr:flagellar basal-body rod protein FlgF [Burkholderiales bacterium]